MKTKYVVITSQECMPSSCWGRYGRVAVMEMEAGAPYPKMISDRAKGLHQGGIDLEQTILGYVEPLRFAPRPGRSATTSRRAKPCIMHKECKAKKQCKLQRYNVPDETHALCKELGVSVRLYQVMEFWMLRHWLRCRMWDSMRRCEVGLCGKY